MLLTGCWEVGCLWSKVGHGHLRCLPWWRRISTQTVWLLKMETSPWAAHTVTGQLLIQAHLQHTPLMTPQQHPGINPWTVPPSTSLPEFAIHFFPFLSFPFLSFPFPSFPHISCTPRWRVNMWLTACLRGIRSPTHLPWNERWDVYT